MTEIIGTYRQIEYSDASKAQSENMEREHKVINDGIPRRKQSSVSDDAESVASSTSDRLANSSIDDNQNRIPTSHDHKDGCSNLNESNKSRKIWLGCKRGSIDDRGFSAVSLKELFKKFANKSSKDDKTTTDLQTVKVDKLPQVFVVKYLGKRECNGLWGLDEIRGPVDEMVQEVMKELDEGAPSVQLPLLYAIISHKGLELRPHKNNRIENYDIGLIPIDFISYGVQDVKYWRVFAFIVVNEMSSRSKKVECHAFVCDTPVNARLVALSLSAAFSVYRTQLETEGRKHRFHIELKPPGDLEKEIDC